LIRRLIAVALAFGLFAQAAEARTLIITGEGVTGLSNDSDAGFASSQSKSRNLNIIVQLIRQTGGTVGFATDRQVKTEWARNGYVVRGGVFGSSGASAPGYLDQYDAVVFLGAKTETGAARCAPDSMSRYNKYPKVPFAWIGNNGDVQGQSPFNAYAEGAPSPDDTSGFDNSPAGTHIYSYNGIKVAGKNLSWTAMAYTRALNVAAAPDSRTIIAPLLLARASDLLDSEQTGVNCTWCNHTKPDNTLDSAFVIKKMWTDIADSKPFVLAMMSQYMPSDSTHGWAVPSEGEMTIALSVLAALDSASGGRVFGDKPVIMAPVMDKGLHRGERRGPNGIFAADTAGHYAIVDSIRANGIPLTVAFDTDLDTLAAYGRDLIKYAQASSIHFTPQVWTGVMDTTKASGNTSLMRQRDVFGRWRNRAAYGDSLRHTVTGSDTTLAAGLYAMRARGDSILTAYGVSGSRISRIAMAPDDDWSPLLLRRSACMCPCPDSVLYAVKQAGFAGIVVDVQDAEADANRGGTYANTNPRGWFGKEMNYRSKFLSDFKLLGHAGYPWMGGRAQHSTYQDSIAPFDSLIVGIQTMEMARAWYAAFLTSDRSYDVWPYDSTIPNAVWPYWSNNHFHKADFVYGLRGPAHILRFSASDFSGDPAAPAANGYHVLKSIQQACQAINMFAGRTIVRLGYPDEIQP